MLEIFNYLNIKKVRMLHMSKNGIENVNHAKQFEPACFKMLNIPNLEHLNQV